MVTTINFITGHLGSGKTILLIIRAFIDTHKGRKILANFPTNKAYIRSAEINIDKVMDLLDRLNPDDKYTFLLDEAHTQIDSKEAMTMKNKLFGDFVSQLRKRNCNLYYVSQFRKGADHRTRELTDYEIQCRALRNPDDDNDETNLYGFHYRVFDRLDDTLINEFFIPAQLAQLFYPMYQTRTIFRRLEYINKSSR